MSNKSFQTYHSCGSSREFLNHASLAFYSATLHLHLVSIYENTREGKNNKSHDRLAVAFLVVLRRRYFLPPAWLYLIYCYPLPFFNIYFVVKWRNEIKFCKPTEKRGSIQCIVNQSNVSKKGLITYSTLRSDHTDAYEKKKKLDTYEVTNRITSSRKDHKCPCFLEARGNI